MLRKKNENSEDSILTLKMADTKFYEILHKLYDLSKKQAT